jgi:hypothetical protein
VISVIAALKQFCSLNRIVRLAARLQIRFMAAMRRLKCPAWMKGSSGRALTASLLLHLSLLACAAYSWLPESGSSSEAILETSWANSTDGSAALIEIVAGEAAAPSPVDGGSVGGFLPQFRPLEADVPLPVSSALANWNLEAAANADLAKTVGAPVNPNGPGFGRGQGQGSGNGKGNGRQGGDGKSFFGGATEGNSFVYVLDCSLSMNHPHDSEAKTRFGRMKIELINSISQLKPDQLFFIVFFNHEAIPMPADGLVAATPENLRHYLNWMEQVPAKGDTDPTGALHIAMRLRPDVVYFLTDGCFSRDANEIVETIRQQRSVIHTFAFEPWLSNKEKAGLELIRQKKISAAMNKLGEATYRRTREIFVAEQVMQGLAEHNRGQYHVIQ